jgi:DNA-binding response OmpR family regulator
MASILIVEDDATILATAAYDPRREGQRVTRAGVPVALPSGEFDRLAFLVRHRGQGLSAERLLERVWGYDHAGDARTVPVHVRVLRQKLEEDPSRPRRIETVRGVGCRFAG